jgi:hypothetical protein
MEVRRYGRLLLALRIEEGQTVEAYSYIGYDNAGSSAGRVDRFYLAVQDGHVKEVRQLSDELERIGSLDRDMECAWYALESRSGDSELASRIQHTVNTRKDPLVPAALSSLVEKALMERNYGLIDTAAYMVEHTSNGCVDR